MYRRARFWCFVLKGNAHPSAHLLMAGHLSRSVTEFNESKSILNKMGKCSQKALEMDTEALKEQMKVAVLGKLSIREEEQVQQSK